MFWRYVKFELKCQFAAKKTIVIALLFTLGLLGYFAYSIYMHQGAEEARLESLRTELRLVGIDQLFFHLNPEAMDHFDPEVVNIWLFRFKIGCYCFFDALEFFRI